MEGPTPISALIHAADHGDCQASVMVSRMSPLFEMSTTALSFVLIIGATTAVAAWASRASSTTSSASSAYSTLSQLGYMTVALGVSAYRPGCSIW